MSLYDDLGVGASDTKTEGWSKNFKLLQSQLKVKKAALTQAKTQRMKQTTVLAPVIDLKRGGSSDDRQNTDTPPHATGLKDALPTGFSSGDVLIPLADEYDPMFPNDYEKVVKRHREERQRQREQERQKEIEEREKKRKDRHDGGAPSGFSRFPAAEEDSDEDDEYEKERRKRSMGGAAIAPPSSLVDRDGPAAFSYDDDARPSRGSKAAIPPPMYDDDRPRSPPGPTSSFLANMGGTVAHKIMQKYGFKEGQGLGKHEQGLSTALSVEKTSKRGGKIIIGDAAEKPGSSQSGAAETSIGGFPADSKKSEMNPLTEILKNPTKVVLLRIAEVPDDEAVRIFLEFERVESAIKAVVDLNGRYFGGRVVKACFYNLDKFRILDLGEQV
ncbi:unnamed protein product [Menidia menidia]|uniref:Splicing factor 45 n=1 Tax=Menidia menidia TaxID=238744 RepID=A0A8S4B5B8_9TELE|nr:unnamed protein product [Menidia menidia]